jgi:hypothetical protein
MAGASQQDRLNLAFEGIRIEVTGLGKALRALSEAGDYATDMKELMHSTGEIVATAARRRAPYQSGALQGSIRAGRGKTKAVVRAGSKARVPYAGVVHYGWPARNITGSEFMVDALEDSRDEAFLHINAGIKDLLKKAGLSS